MISALVSKHLFNILLFGRKRLKMKKFTLFGCLQYFIVHAEGNSAAK